jgi:hypothetical protein
MQNNKQYNAKGVVEFLIENGLPNTAKWIKYAFRNRSSKETKLDVYDVINCLETEIGMYRRDEYPYLSFQKECYKLIFDNFINGMKIGTNDFLLLIKGLTPILYQIAETNGLLKELVDMAKNLEGKPKFYQFCFVYLILCEGPYKSVETALVALKQLSNGKNILEIDNNKQLEYADKRKILPLCLKDGNHDNIRNAIAHCHFRYLSERDQMEFWDIRKDGTYSLRPLRLDFDDFSKKLLEVNIFCGVFAITFLTLVAIEDIYNKKLKITYDK